MAGHPVGGEHHARRWILLPGLTEARRYQRAWLRGDLIAGLTVSAFLIPQVLAYAAVAGLPPVTGLWAAVPPLVLYALLGSSRALSLGPESATALMTAVAIGPLAAGSPTRYAMLATTLAFLVGLMAVVAGLLRLGFITDLLSRPVIVGYMLGLAAIMIAGQLGRITGVPQSGRSFITDIASFASHAAGVDWVTVALAVGVLVFVLITARWKTVPGALIAVAGAALIVWGFGLASRGVAVVGQFPGGLPPFRVPELRAADLQALAVPAVSVLVIGFSDDVLTARAFARHDEHVIANQELIALGVSNVAVSLVRGFPVSSSASRTAIGRATGSRTQLYSLVAAAVTLAVLAGGHTLIAHIPDAALGALVIYAALRLIDIAALRRLFAFRRRELMIAAAAFAGVLVFNLLYGVLIAVGISVAELLIRVARPHDAVLGQVPGLAGMHDVDDYPAARTIPGLVVYRYDAPLFFANADDFRRRALAAADSEDDLAWFVLNVEANVEVDFTALEAVEYVRAELTGRGVVFGLARVKQDLLARLRTFGLAAKIGDEYLFPTLPTAVSAYTEWASRHDGERGAGR